MIRKIGGNVAIYTVVSVMYRIRYCPLLQHVTIRRIQYRHKIRYLLLPDQVNNNSNRRQVPHMHRYDQLD